MTKASIVILSHLSDAAIEFGIGDNRTANLRIEFTKYLILKLNGILDQEIDPDAYFAEYTNKTF
jgi:hypothetical protein